MKRVTLALVPGPRTDALLTNQVSIDGDVMWETSAARSVDQNSRRMLAGEFDVAEMSFSTFIKARDIGGDLIGLPIFTGRGFLQPGLVVATASDITRPEDVAGKRVGVPQFWMTSTMWHRAILQRQHGVREEQITWYTTSTERFDDVPRAPGVEMHELATADLLAALTDGNLDAIMVPPRGAPRELSRGLSWPYADVEAATDAYFVATGIVPIMHFVVMKASLHTERPELAGSLLAAFGAAKERAIAGDPVDERLWSDGIDENAAAIEAFLSFAVEKGWIAPGRSAADFFVAV